MRIVSHPAKSVGRLQESCPPQVPLELVTLKVDAAVSTGMRLMECLRLRIKDVDFARDEMYVRSGKGKKGRRVPLPISLRERLFRQREWTLLRHASDLAQGIGRVYLPHALARKYPNADTKPG